MILEITPGGQTGGNDSINCPPENKYLIYII